MLNLLNFQWSRDKKLKKYDNMKEEGIKNE